MDDIGGLEKITKNEVKMIQALVEEYDFAHGGGAKKVGVMLMVPSFPTALLCWLLFCVHCIDTFAKKMQQFGFFISSFIVVNA